VTARPLRLATRGSPLARWQANWVADQLRAAHPGLAVDLVIVTTQGDRRLDVPVWAMGGQGVFVKEVQAAVLEGEADAAVHSAKDLPSAAPAAGLTLAAVPPRGDHRDALVGGRLAELAAGALVATGAVRRRAQLAWLRPDLSFTSLRGNIGTRLEKVPPGGALVVAAAALARLGRQEAAAEMLPPALMLPQVGQGAVAVECRPGDTATAGLLAAIHHPASGSAVTAERAFLGALSGGCDVPVGALARAGAGGEVTMDGLMASADGRIVLRRQAAGPDPETVGSSLAAALLDAGGEALIEYRPPSVAGGGGRPGR
jgi:hydroxymethylbilane synthase